MVFSSVAFVFYFMPLFLVFYFFCGARNAALLVGSSFFYVWGEGAYVLLLFALIAVNFYLGIAVSDAVGMRRSLMVTATVMVNLIVLAFFKYADFVFATVGSLTGFVVPQIGVRLPLGISFFTFQLISYIVDVGRGSVVCDRNAVRFATYIMMFPHLIAGPIVRYADINDELADRRITLEKFGLGLQFFIVGLSQKVLIANSLASAADKVFSYPASEIDIAVAWLGVVSYTLQIYFDFCGYSNMAIGLAFLMGFRFPRNFDYPYSSRSLTEFWRRWHISLSFWFRDYVYIPLGGNRGGRLRTARNLLIVFFLTGLWHGASWTFVLWGMFHGAFLLAERLGLNGVLRRLPPALSWAYCMVVVMVGWVLFRSHDLAQAEIIVQAMFGLGSAQRVEPVELWLNPETKAAMVAGIILSFPVVPNLLKSMRMQLLNGPVVPGTGHCEVATVRAVPIFVLALGFCISCMLLVANSLNPFLYFRF